MLSKFTALLIDTLNRTINYSLWVAVIQKFGFMQIIQEFIAMNYI